VLALEDVGEESGDGVWSVHDKSKGSDGSGQGRGDDDTSGGEAGSWEVGGEHRGESASGEETWLIPEDIDEAQDPEDVGGIESQDEKPEVKPDQDSDADGFLDSQDCAPFDPAVHPGAIEACNGLDDDCDGAADPPGTLGCKTYYFDKDKDGFGAVDATSQCLCGPAGPYTSPWNLDCDDNDPLINTTVPEKCNQIDDNCNGVVDDGVCFTNCKGDQDCLQGWKCNDNTGVCFNLSCLAQFEPGSFSPAQEWAWTGSGTAPSHNQVMATPAIGDLDGDGHPEIVFVTFAGSQYNQNGIVRAIHGDGTGEVFTLTGQAVYGGAMPALADVDGDGGAEIFVAADGGGVHAWDNDGKYLWSGGTGIGDPSVADLNGDGTPEIVHEYQVFSPSGQLLWAGQKGQVYTYNKVSVADLDGDGFQDVTMGDKAYSPYAAECPVVPCGKLLWDSGAGGNFTAVADLDMDGLPDVVVAWAHKLTARHGKDGSLMWEVPVPGTGGGPPNIADFDGDGEPEIGLAGKAAYTVFEGVSGAVIWTKQTQDYSSSSTGSSVFDFDGDGKAEVVYNDELTLRIYSGPTGDVLYSTPNGSGTLFEYPVIADVDADNNAEIIVASNDYAYGSHHGIRVLGDAKDHWVSTRKIWNQHAYHITNVNEDGSIPAAEAPSWLAHNTYRCNLQMQYDPLASPDGLPIPWPIDTIACPDKVLLTVIVRNIGTLPLPKGTEVGFFKGPPENGLLAGKVLLKEELEPGDETSVEFYLDVKGTPGTIDVYVVVDPDGKVSECAEDNNSAVIPGVGCVGY